MKHITYLHHEVSMYKKNFLSFLLVFSFLFAPINSSANRFDNLERVELISIIKALAKENIQLKKQNKQWFSNAQIIVKSMGIGAVLTYICLWYWNINPTNPLKGS